MKFKSFEELECLLSNEEKEAYYEWKNCKEVLAQRPSYMQTQHRILPYLPSWMKKNVIDVRELFNCNNTSYGTRLLWIRMRVAVILVHNHPIFYYLHVLI